MSPKQASSCLVILFVLAFAIATAQMVAQTSLDDVHVSPREAPTVVAAAYPTSNTGPYSGAGVLRTSANLVLVSVNITDELHRPVVGLYQDNFELFEGRKPQQITNFSNEDTPVSLGILVDTSASMSYKLDRARDAIVQFCETANPQDEFFLITFSDTPRVTTDFTTDTAHIENDLLTERSKGETSLLDAIYMGIEKMRDARYSRKALLILSDGGDNHSRYSERDVKAAIREADVMIYAVGTYDRYVSTQEELLGPELLESVAKLTGGQAFALNNPNDMPEVTQRIGTQLRHQYVLAYQPQSAANDGKWHKISVKLRQPKKFPFFHVDARPGYYAGGG